MKKLVKWQKFKTALCDLTKKLLPLNFVSFKSIWKPNPWMNPLERNLLHQNLLYHLNDFNDLNFFLKNQIKTCQDCDQLRPFTVKRTGILHQKLHIFELSYSTATYLRSTATCFRTFLSYFPYRHWDRQERVFNLVRSRDK